MKALLRYAPVIGSVGAVLIWGWISYSIATVDIDSACLTVAEREAQRLPLTIVMLSAMMGWAIVAVRDLKDFKKRGDES